MPRTFVIALALMLAVVGAIAGAHVLASPTFTELAHAEGLRPLPTADIEQPPPPTEQTRTDNYGDPLPKGAVARFGTVRLRDCGAVVFSHNGKQVITAAGSSRSDVVFWDRKTGKELRRLPAGGTIDSLHISPDGRWLAASCNADTSHPVWDAATGKEMFRITGHLENFNSDSKYVLTVLAIDQAHSVIIRWDVSTGRINHTWVMPKGTPRTCIWADGKTAAFSTGDSIVFYDLDNMAQTQRIAIKGRRVSFSPDGKCMAGAGDYGVELWDIAIGKKLWGNEQSASIAAVFSPDSNRLAWAGSDGLEPGFIWIYEVGALKPRRFERPIGGGVRFLTFSPDGKTLAVTTSAGAVLLLDVQTGKDELPIIGTTDGVHSLSLLPDGQHLATIELSGVLLWELKSAKLVRRFPEDLPVGESILLESVAAGKVVTRRKTEEPLHVRDLVTGKEILTLATPAGFVGNDMRSAAVTADGRLIAIHGRTEACVFDVMTGRCLLRYSPAQTLLWLRFLAGGRLLEVTLHQPKKGLVNVYLDIQTGNEATPDQVAGAISLRAGGRWLESADDRLSQLEKMALKDAEGKLAFADFKGTVDEVVESPGGHFLAVTFVNRLGQNTPFTVHTLWDLTTGLPLDHIKLPDNQYQMPHSFTADNRILITTSKLGIHLWDMATGNERLCLNMQTITWASRVQVTPDFRFLISADNDSQVLLWDLTGRSPDGVWRTVQHSAPKRLALWDQLAGLDAAISHKAVWELAADPAGTVAFLETKLKPVPATDNKVIAQFIDDLDSNVFAKRQEAQSQLRKIGEPAVPAMRAGVGKSTSLEQRQRLQKLLEEMDNPRLSGDRLRVLRGLEVLERIGNAEAQRLLDTLAQGAAGARLTCEAKESLERLESQDARPAAKKAPAPVVEKDLPYADGGDERMLDLYLPAKKGFTTIVFTFGGGWHTGSRKAVTAIGEKLQSLGFGCALLSHRLAPKDKFPAQAEDVAAAFAWVSKNIEAKGGDPKRVVLMGHSSGAHLSLLLATDPKYLAAHKLSPADIAGVVGLSTPLDLEPRQDKKGFGDTLMAGKGADVFARDAAVMKAASPIQHISKNLPPTLLVVGEKDFPMLQGDARAFAQKAKSVGREVTVFVGMGFDHMGTVRTLLEDQSAVLDQVLAFLNKLTDNAK